MERTLEWTVMTIWTKLSTENLGPCVFLGFR